MATTWAQRQTEAQAIMRGALGVIAIPLVHADQVLTKDPRGTVPTGGAVTPVNGETTPTPGWILWAGGDAQTAYGL